MSKWEIGQTASMSKTISESDIYMFAGLTGDFNSAHVNAVEAQKNIFGERIAHGILVTGLISAVIGMKLPGEGTIYMEQDVRFLKPVMIGDTVTAEATIEEIVNDKKNIFKLKTIVKNQNNELVIDGFAIVKAPKESEE